MVINERLIKFPVPDWNRVISSDLDSMAYCICYQHSYTSENYGPYGFTTDKSSKILTSTFPNLFLCKEKLVSAKSISEEGIYLYGDNEKIKHLLSELNKYHLAVKKNEIKMKKSLPTEPAPVKPLLTDISKNHNYDSETIKKIINAGCGVLISHYYMPEAGASLILFDQDAASSLEKNALKYGITFNEVNSINALKPW